MKESDQNVTSVGRVLKKNGLKDDSWALRILEAEQRGVFLSQDCAEAADMSSGYFSGTEIERSEEDGRPADPVIRMYRERFALSVIEDNFHGAAVALIKLKTRLEILSNKAA